MEVKSWRFLNTGFQNGFINMAIDEIISQISVPRDQKPVLRVYGWRPYAISIGYNQDINDIDLERCKGDNINVVRRPTGGRAVFHAEEVTYSVILPSNCPLFNQDTLSVYNAISQCLVEGLRLIGVNTELIKRKTKILQAGKSDVPCFSNSARYEITYQGKKLVGSAQRRYKYSILQHGSILVGVKHLKLGEYISGHKDIDIENFTKYLYKKTVSISQIILTKPKYDKIIWGIKNGFQNIFNIRFLEGQLTPQENHEVKKLLKKQTKIGGE